MNIFVDDFKFDFQLTNLIIQRALLEELRAQEDEFRSEHDRMIKEGYTIEDTIASRDQEIRRIKDEIFQYRQRVNAKKHDVDDYNRDLVSLKSITTKLQAELKEVQGLLNEEKKAGSGVKSEFSQVETHIEKLNDEIQDGRNRITVLEGEIAASRQNAIDADNQVLAAGRQISELETKTYYLGDRKNAYNADIDRLNQKVLSLKDLVLRYKTEKEQFEKERADEEARIKSLQDQIIEMEGNIKEDMKTIDDLELEKVEIARNIDYTESKIRQNEIYYDEVRGKIDILRRDNDVLRHDISLMPSRVLVRDEFYRPGDRKLIKKEGSEDIEDKKEDKKDGGINPRAANNIKRMFGR